MARRIFSSESVTEGHPDKMCDIISDAVLDEILWADPYGRVACETTACVGMIHLMGEITTAAHPDYEAIVRKAVNDIGYDGESAGFDGNNCAVILSLNRQSMDIDLGVSRALESRDFGNRKVDIGAGDQGMMFGFACQDTEELMPLPITLAHRLAKRLTEVRKNRTLDYLRPDGKSQVSVEYEDDRPVRIDTVVIAAQHQPYVSAGRISRDVIREVIVPALPPNLVDDSTRFLVNTTGRFSIGGPKGDAGLTGRKIIVDTYGGYASHGGGAFSGKDPTKVDRTGSYAARYIAKNIVASGAARQCSIQLAYSIGVAQPVSVYISTAGTGRVSDEVLASIVRDKVDLRPAALIERFDMRRPIYKQVAAYGHFGRQELDLPWEKTDIADLF